MVIVGWHPVSGEEPINSWRKIAMQVQTLSKVETVLIDNEYIQTYSGKYGIWHEGRQGDALKTLAQKYGVQPSDIIAINSISEKTRYLSGSQWVFLPFSESYIEELKIQGIERLSMDVPNGEFIWPVEGNRITSRVGNRWGRVHPGLDIATPTGTVVVSALEGEVVQAKFSGAYGNIISIAHADNYVTRYAHLSKILVKKGDKISKGQIVALSGSTGRSTGPHLHFEVRYKNVILDPEFFLPDFESSMKAIARARKEQEEIISN
ncbi:MAG: M23 family metallopeptidase [Leptospirales bacterium]